MVQPHSPEQIVLANHGHQNGEATQHRQHWQTEPLGAAEAGDQIAQVEQWQGKYLDASQIEMELEQLSTRFRTDLFVDIMTVARKLDDGQ